MRLRVLLALLVIPGISLGATGQKTGTASGVADVTPSLVRSTGSTVSRSLAARFADVANVKDFGAKGDGSTDDTAAIRAAITAKNSAALSPGTYLVSGTITLGQGQALRGQSGRKTFLRAAAGFAGPVVKLTDQQAILSDVDIEGTGTAVHAFTGVQLYDASRATVERVRVWSPNVGFELVGSSYWNRLDVDAYSVRTVGVDLKVGGTVNPVEPPNNNWIFFRAVVGENWPTTGDSWAFRVQGGLNVFVGGEPAQFRYAWEFLDSGGKTFNNRIVSCFEEHNDYGIKAAAKTSTYIQSQFSTQAHLIDSEAVVVTEGLDDVAAYLNVLGGRLSSKGLKLLYLFNEGSGTKVVDHSGNGRHVATQTGGTPLWRTDGLYGGMLHFDTTAGTSRGLDSIPTASVDWTQPFTVALLTKYEGVVGPGATMFRITDGGGNFLELNNAGVDYDQLVVSNSSPATFGVGKIRRNADGWSWSIFYVDPVAGTVTSLQPFSSTQLDETRTPSPSLNFSTISAFTIGRGSTSRGMVGGIQFAGVWQRRLTRKEVLHLVNMRTPWAPAFVPAAAQADSVAADVATLKTDFNSLLAKLRAAGVIIAP